MSFLSLYRKYRPENFNDLIGQDQVKQTLKNALKNDRVAHAYLFAGPRGTGKTSAAKVFAKSLNCANPTADFEPCGECNSCQRIEKGNSLDVIEIDAASNRGIDEIRELREKVKFYPGEGKYKVYIIDEVHMLTKGAFNALLKTLEEPPDSVVFILATTEPHKVITTIISRCQRFDFSLLTLTNLKKRLKYIAQAEGYEIEKEALDILARSARGGMRDAISLLDQAISFSDGQLNAEQIAMMLGRIDKADLKEFLIYLSQKEGQKALELLNKQLESGLGIERFSDELIEYCRELLLIKECGIESGILEYSRSYLEEIASVAANFSTTKITDIIDEFASLKEKLRSSARPRLQLEISVIKLSNRGSTDHSLASRLSELEFKLDNYIKSSRNSQTETKTKIKQEKLAAQKQAAAQNKAKRESDFKKEAASQNEKVKPQPQTQPQTQSETDTKQQSQAGKQSSKKQSAEGKTLSLEAVKENWAGVLQKVRTKDISVQALLREGRPAAVKGKTVIVAFPEDKKFHYKGASSNQALILKVLRKVLAQTVELEFQLGAKKKIAKQKSDPHSEVEATKLEAEKETKQKLNHSSKQNEVQANKENLEKNIEQKTKKAEKPSAHLKEPKMGPDGDLDIEDLAQLFAGEVIEVDQSILKNRGGN
ncbi:MAG: DNA polymerase III subunit gamma/tau [Bacillota bacterium]